MDDRKEGPLAPVEGRNRQVWRYFVSAWRGFAVGGVFLLATNLLALRIPREIGGAIEQLRAAVSASAIDTGAIEVHAWTIALLAIGAGIARVFSRIFTFNAARRIEYNLRNVLFARLTTLDAAFFQRSATGDLVSRVVNDTTYVRLLYGVGTLHIINASIAYVIVLGLMLSVSWELTLYCLAPYPVVFFTIRLFTRAIYKRTHAAQAELSNVSTRAQENLAGATVVRAFALEQHEAKAFREASDAYLRKNLALARIRGAMIPYMGAVSGLGTLIVLFLGGQRVIDGVISLGDYVEFASYIVILAWPTIAMGWVLSMWHRGAAAFDRLSVILAAQPGVAQPPPERATPMPSPHEGGGQLHFRDVHLTYEDGTSALVGLNLEIAAGSTVAIVGRTGAGKSSLVELIPRLRDPTAGAITLNGVDLRDIPLEQLRSAIGHVPQDPFLFSMTVRENIQMGKQLLTRSDDITIEDALEIAALSEDVNALPMGINTMVGERGITLSGGQKQRVTIARAVLQSPCVLILDDSLAAVDTHTERRILTGLSTVMPGRTCLLVTHRFNALEHMDEIIVLDHGQIVERGQHGELLKLGGVYARLWKQQMLEEAVA